MSERMRGDRSPYFADEGIDSIHADDANKLALAFKENPDKSNSPYVDNFFKLACENGATACIKLLVEKGANPRVNNDAALQWVSGCGNFDAFKYLIESCGLNNKDSLEESLIQAARLGSLDIVKYLHSIGVDIHAKLDAAFRVAATKSNAPIIKFLIESGVNPDLNDGTALRWSVVNNDIETVECLIALGADIHKCDDDPLKIAADSVNTKIFDLIFKQDPNYFEVLIEQDKDLQGKDTVSAYLQNRKLSLSDEAGRKRPKVGL